MYPYPTMPPQKSLSLAISLEDEHIRNFREWALRLRPFEPGLAQLFERLLEEMKAHRGELLYHASRHLEWENRLRSPFCVDDPTDPDHFFILSENTAIAVLQAAVTLKDEARRFYRYCVSLAPCRSPLGELFARLGAFKQSHIEVLQASLERFQCRPAWHETGSVRSAAAEHMQRGQRRI